MYCKFVDTANIGVIDDEQTVKPLKHKKEKAKHDGISHCVVIMQLVAEFMELSKVFLRLPCSVRRWSRD